MTRETGVANKHLESRRQNSIEINRHIFPDQMITRMSQYEIKKTANHVYMTPTSGANTSRYSFSYEYYKPNKRVHFHDIAGDFLRMMEELHRILDTPRGVSYQNGICDPNDIDLLEECARPLLEFVNRYGLFNLDRELSVHSEMLELDLDGRQHRSEERMIPIIGTRRFKDFLLDFDFKSLGLTGDYTSNLDHGFFTGSDYRRLFFPWTDPNEVFIYNEYLENYSENVALILNSDIFISAYYHTILRDISSSENHTRHLENQGVDDEPQTSIISRFDDIRARDLVSGHYMYNSLDPSKDTLESLLPHIVDDLWKYRGYIEESEEDPMTFDGYDLKQFFDSLHYRNVSFAEFKKLCDMIEPLGRGDRYRLPDCYQVRHHIEFNGNNSKWEFITEAMSFIGMILNRRTLDLAYNNIETRICARPGCGHSFTKKCGSSKIYHSTRCQTRAGVKRSREKAKRASTPPPEECPLK